MHRDEQKTKDSELTFELPHEKLIDLLGALDRLAVVLQYRN